LTEDKANEKKKNWADRQVENPIMVIDWVEVLTVGRQNPFIRGSEGIGTWTMRPLRETNPKLRGSSLTRIRHGTMGTHMTRFSSIADHHCWFWRCEQCNQRTRWV